MPMSPPSVKVRIDGAWVDVGGSGAPAGEEVVVGGAEPTDAVTELWYDEADPGAPAVDDAHWPRGVVGYDKSTVNAQTQGPGVRWSLGVRVAWTADPSRVYQTTLVVGHLNVTGGVAANAEISVCDDAAGTTRKGAAEMSLGVDGRGALTVLLVEGGLSGPVHREGFQETSAGTLISAGDPAAGRGAYLLVEDIGAVSSVSTELLTGDV